MAIRNAGVGGSDWATGELGLKSDDLNDTFDAIVSKTKELSSFWLNSFLRETYDNFQTYANGASIPTTLWSYSYTGVGTGTFLCSTTGIISGGDLAEGVMTATLGGGGINLSGALTATSNILTSDRHLFFKVSSSTTGSNTGINYISVDSGVTQHSIPVLGTYPFPVFVHALGSNSYKVYIGSKTVQTGNITTLRIILTNNVFSAPNNPASSILYISDIYTSGSTIS